MEFEIKLTLMGVIFSAISSTWVYWRQKNDVRTASGRKLLYYSLELRHWLQSEFIKIGVHAKPLYEYYISCFKSKGYEVSEIDIQPFIEWVNNALSGAINQHPVEITDKFIQSYENTLSDFSAILPIVAYEQEGYKGLNRMITFLKEYNLKN